MQWRGHWQSAERERRGRRKKSVYFRAIAIAISEATSMPRGRATYTRADHIQQDRCELCCANATHLNLTKGVVRQSFSCGADSHLLQRHRRPRLQVPC